MLRPFLAQQSRFVPQAVLNRTACVAASANFDVHGNYDVVVVGGGVVGLSAAYHIAEKLGTGSGVCMVEKDPQYRKASAVLSAGQSVSSEGAKITFAAGGGGEFGAKNSGGSVSIASGESQGELSTCPVY